MPDEAVGGSVVLRIRILKLFGVGEIHHRPCSALRAYWARLWSSASSRSLLVAMLLTGKTKEPESAATWFWQALAQHHEALERLAAEHFPGLTGLSLNKMPGSMPEIGAEEMTADLDAILDGCGSYRPLRQP